MYKNHHNKKLTREQILCVQDICTSETFADALAKYVLYVSRIPNVSIIKCNTNGGGVDLYEPFERTSGIEDQLYTPFYGGKVNFVDRYIISKWIATGDATAFAERSVSFDTQTVSYLYRYSQNKREALPENFDSVVHVMRSKSIGVDYIPYASENLLFSCEKREVVLDTLIAFEKMLYNEKKSDRACRKQAEKTLKLYERMRFQNGNEITDLWGKVYVVLLEIIMIQFKYRSQSVDKRMRQLCEFMNSKLGLIMYPELILAKRYFEQGANLAFFGKIQKGKKDIIETLRNMAWDLFHLRILEMDCAYTISFRAKFFVPYMFTYDKRLLQIKDCYALNALAIDKKSLDRFPFYTHADDILPYVVGFSTIEAYEKRRELNLTMNFPEFIMMRERALEDVMKK